MAWVQVHEDLLHNLKLRRFSRELQCSRHEAIGILVFLWIFAVHTADESGLIECVSPEDIFKPDPSKPYTPESVTAALIRAGFLDQGKEADSYVIHDWDYWQSVWISEKRRREGKARYMREYRDRDQAEKE